MISKTIHMKKRPISRALFCTILALILVLFHYNMHAFSPENKDAGKQALLIIGDAHHAAFPIYRTIGKTLERTGYATDIVMDYEVPFRDFSQYDLIVLSRYAYNDLVLSREHQFNFAKGSENLWLTGKQEQAFEDFVNAGGSLFLHHDGIGFYPRKGAIHRLAKAYFLKHPPIGTITVSPTGNLPGLTRGVEAFQIEDEEFLLEMDESQTYVFMESHSAENGRIAQGWAHEYGKGKVVVFIPGHGKKVLFHPMVEHCVENIIQWLDE